MNTRSAATSSCPSASTCSADGRGRYKMSSPAGKAARRRLAAFSTKTRATTKSKTPAAVIPRRAFWPLMMRSLFDFVLRVQTRAARHRAVRHDRARALVRRLDRVAVEIAEGPRLEVRARLRAGRVVLVDEVERIVDREVQRRPRVGREVGGRRRALVA